MNCVVVVVGVYQAEIAQLAACLSCENRRERVSSRENYLVQLETERKRRSEKGN